MKKFKISSEMYVFGMFIGMLVIMILIKVFFF